MRSKVFRSFVLLMTLACGTWLSGQDLDQMLKNYKGAAAHPEDRTTTFSSAQMYAAFLLQSNAMHEAETSRIDKQTEASSGSGLSTSAVTKGSVPWLFAFAVEHGALTQSVDGNVITFKGNVANAIKAINAKDYVKSFKLGESNLFVRNVSRATFGVSFNSSSGNASPAFNTNTFASANAHVDLYNHRDPRDSKWTSSWLGLSTSALHAVANAAGDFEHLVQTGHKTEFDAWQSRAQTIVAGLSDGSTDDQIKKALEQIGNDFAATFGGFAEVQQKAKATVDALANYSTQKKAVIEKMNKSPILSLEYTFTNQASTSLPTSTTQNVSVSAKPPNLSNINLIFTGYLGANTQATLNASTTLFSSLPSGTKIGTVRDYRVAGQIDVPIDIHSLGTTDLSFSALFLSLLQEPLGQQVLVNTVPVSTRGNINLLQAKWSIPMGDGGFKIPISITRSNRTELIKENDIRGTIGISYDFDALFSKLK
jgi:hypothetical protein